MNNASGSNKLWSGQFTIVVVMALVFFLCLQLLTAGFPAYITDIKNNPTQGGLMTTFFMLAAIITRPIIGYLIPKVNMKLMNIGTLIFLAITVAMSFGQESVGFLLFLRVLHGIAFGILSTSIATMATKIIPSNRIGEGIGYYGMSTSGGTSFAPMIAIAILQSISYNVLIAVSVVLTIVTLVLTFFVKGTKKEKTVYKKDTSDQTIEKISFKEYAFDKRALLPCSLVSLFTFSLGGVTAFIKQLGAEANIAETASLFFLVMAIVMIISKAVSGILFDRIGHKKIMYPAIISGIIGLYLLSITQSTATLLIAGFFYGIAYGFITPTCQTLAVSRLKRRNKELPMLCIYPVWILEWL